jgi:hypothetical protein
MKVGLFFYIVVLLIAGCELPKSSLFENQLRDIKVPELSEIRKSSIKKTFDASFNQTWKDAVTILTRYAIIPKVLKVSEKAGTITYIDIDGFYYYEKWKYGGGVLQDGVLQEEKEENVLRIFSVELPFTVLIEENYTGKTEVYILPRMELLGDKIPEEKMKVLKIASKEKAEQLLERISTQLSAHTKWKWILE